VPYVKLVGVQVRTNLSQVGYYSGSNPEFAALGKRTVEEVIADARTA
jgi:hypothetical protein